MAEAAQSRVQTAIKDFINEIDRTKLRGLERSMHLCAADCCTDTTATVEDVHRCVEKCQGPTQRSQQYVQSELERFQEALSRCVLQCQDDVKDKVGPNTSETEIRKYRGEFETCAIACCDKNIAKLPNLMEKLKSAFNSGPI
ncbi:protein FAM136A [Eurytemora carolleeae]|uniref:protein FAM136A n=1 Tax=Eurytemora carolleeae TaxID=1294199 RepID=UPI000C76B823|nr:protein FAM136A [Eurytemora carolleeae]XP_023347451.1 protein FAM136A [Eurytemora carolleeae]|eukprot:XP_023347450.1 protein FAM136A-like [Eurytemora affinis]